MPVAAECYGKFSCDLSKKGGNQKSTIKNIVTFVQFVMEAGINIYVQMLFPALSLTGSGI